MADPDPKGVGMTTDTLFPLTTDGMPTNFDVATLVNLGCEFEPEEDVWVTHLIRWRGSTNDSGVHTGRIFLASDKSVISGTDVTWTDVGTGWQEAALAAAVQLTAGVRYVVAGRYPNGGNAWTPTYFTSGAGGSGVTSPNGLLTAPSSAGSTRGNGVYNNSGTLVCPDLTFGGNNYWLNLRVTNENPDAPATAAGSASGTAAATAVRDAVASAASTAETNAVATAVRIAVATTAASAEGAATATAVRVAEATTSVTAETDATATATRIAAAAAAATATGSAAATAVRIAYATAAGSATGSAVVVDDTAPTAHGSATGTAAATLHPVIRRPRRGTIHRP